MKRKELAAMSEHAKEITTELLALISELERAVEQQMEDCDEE